MVRVKCPAFGGAFVHRIIGTNTFVSAGLKDPPRSRNGYRAFKQEVQKEITVEAPFGDQFQAKHEALRAWRFISIPVFSPLPILGEAVL